MASKPTFIGGMMLSAFSPPRTPVSMSMTGIPLGHWLTRLEAGFVIGASAILGVRLTYPFLRPGRSYLAPALIAAWSVIDNAVVLSWPTFSS